MILTTIHSTWTAYQNVRFKLPCFKQWTPSTHLSQE